MTFKCGVIERAREALIGLSAALGVLAIVPLSAEAAFPGINGDIAYAQGGTNAGIYVTGVGRVSSGQHGEPAWSPGGAKIAFYSYDTGNIIVADADGNNARNVAYLGVNSDVAWDPSGQSVWFTKYTNGFPDGIWQVSASGGTPTPVLQDATALTAGGGLNWSMRSDDYPRGRLVYRCRFRPDRHDLCIYEPPAGSAEIGGGTTRLLPVDYGDFGNLGGGNWSPDGTKIVFSMNHVLTVNAPNNGGSQPSFNERSLFSVSADGSGLSRLTTVVRIPDTDGCPHNTDLGLISLAGPVYSPDGSSVLLRGEHLRMDNINGYCSFSLNNQGLYTVSAGGGTPSLLLPAPLGPELRVPTGSRTRLISPSSSMTAMAIRSMA